MNSEQQSTENESKCEPPCSLACLVTEGVHHSAESLRAAAEECVADMLIPPGESS